MLTHAMVGSNDIAKSKRFYDATLGALGVEPGMENGERVFYRGASGANFGVTKPINGDAACHANGGTIGFAASSPEAVIAFHDAGVANGGTSCEGAPGPRTLPMGTVHLAYLRDPDGNKICAMHMAQ